MKRFFAIVLMILALSACKPIREQVSLHDYSFEGLENIAGGLTQLSIDTKLMLDAENKSGLDIVLTKFEAELYNKNDKKVATLDLATPKGENRPTLHRKTSEKVAVPLTVGFESPLSAISLLAMSLDDFSNKGYTVDYDLTLKAGCLKRRFQGHAVPVETLVKMLER